MAGKKPNVLFILTDDQGIWSMGCYGNSEIQTPNLDKLAKQGVRFDNFFCTSPVCSPARASLLTGKIPSQHGILDYLSGGNGGASQATIEFLKDHRGYTDILAEEGYTCGLSGKWHLGDGGHPQKGFSFWYAHQKGGGPYYNAPMFRNGQKIEEKGYITDVITDEAISFIDREKNKEQPFYLSVHYTAPHSPCINCHPKKYTDLYEDCPFETCPQGEAHPWAKTEVIAGYQKPRESLIGYFAAVTAMDDNVGRILKKLEEENLMEDTLIIFSSDNGFNCGHHGIWGKGNGTFPLNMYDSSVKVPLIMCHKGHIPENHVCDEMHSGYDFMPTLLDYLGYTVCHVGLAAGLFVDFLADRYKFIQCHIVFNFHSRLVGDRLVIDHGRSIDSDCDGVDLSVNRTGIYDVLAAVVHIQGSIFDIRSQINQKVIGNVLV